MLLSINKTILVILLSGLAQLSFAAQYVDHAHERIVEVSISSVEQNALLVEGRKITTVIPSISGALSYISDANSGVLYFSLANRHQMGTISLFVTDDAGQRYRVLLVPRQIAAEEVIIRPPKMTQPDQADGLVATSHTSKIKKMIFSMANYQPNQVISGVDVISQNQEISLWRETNFILTEAFLGLGLRGERYELTNISNQQIVLQEPEFFRRSVVAVSIENHVLPPSHSTVVYIVRQIDQ